MRKGDRERREIRRTTERQRRRCRTRKTRDWTNM